MTFNTQDYHVLRRYKRFSSIREVSASSTFKKYYIYFFTLILIGAVSILVLPWRQSVSGEGRVIAFSPNERRQQISAPVDGRVKEWKVVEGARVSKGQSIVELVDNDPNILERLRLEREAAERKLEAAKLAIETAKKNIDRQQELVSKGLSAPLSLENAKLNYNKYLIDEANAASELARVDVKFSRQSNQDVTSPIDGYILKINAGQGGELVKQGDNLAILVPETEKRVVEIWVDGNDMPLLSAGREVRLQFEGWPAVQFSGWPMVAVGTFGGSLGFVDSADDGKGHFRVIVLQKDGENWPDPRYLRQGVRVKAWVLLDEVTVAYELWRIFNGFPPSLRSYEDVKSTNDPVVKTIKKNLEDSK